MKKWPKDLLYRTIFLCIALAVLIFVVAVLVFYGDSVSYTKYDYQKTNLSIGNQVFHLKFSDDLAMIPDFFPEKDESEPKAWSQPSPRRVIEEEAEPLEGKELYISYVNEICKTYYPDVDPYIGIALMDAETGGTYDPNLESKCGAVGLMQVIPKYHARRAEKYGFNDIWDPYTNIIAGIDLLNELYQDAGNWSDALYGYNHSRKYGNYVIAKAEEFRKDGILG